MPWLESGSATILEQDGPNMLMGQWHGETEESKEEGEVGNKTGDATRAVARPQHQ